MSKPMKIESEIKSAVGVDSAGSPSDSISNAGCAELRIFLMLLFEYF
jgi:hypothetical protein